MGESVKLEILIVGAGLGGLSAAVACALGGHHATVLERSPELAEVRPLQSSHTSRYNSVFLLDVILMNEDRRRTPARS